MSESQTPSVSKSSLNDLRQFRINKTAAAAAANLGKTGTHCVCIVVCGKRDTSEESSALKFLFNFRTCAWQEAHPGDGR